MKFATKALLILMLFFSIEGEAQPIESETPYFPWFTGPLLTPTPVNMEPGHPAIAVSLTVFSSYGLYNDRWAIESIDSILTINPFLDYQFALTERTGIEIQLQSFTNIAYGGSNTSFGDANVLFGYQVSNDIRGTWVPDARFLINVTFPTGKYDQLDPDHPLREVTGRGAFFFGPNLSLQKIFHFNGTSFIFHWATGYFFPLRSRIKGVSLYGGMVDTDGKILSGQYFDLFLAGEYAITQRWAIAFELEFTYQFQSKEFKGVAGVLENGEEAKIGLPAAAQLLFLPEVQYNFTPLSGIIIGGYFSLAGRNFFAVAGGFVSYGYVF
jgi:hypothetical protein